MYYCHWNYDNVLLFTASKSNTIHIYTYMYISSTNCQCWLLSSRLSIFSIKEECLIHKTGTIIDSNTIMNPAYYIPPVKKNSKHHQPLAASPCNQHCGSRIANQVSLCPCLSFLIVIEYLNISSWEPSKPPRLTLKPSMHRLIRLKLKSKMNRWKQPRSPIPDSR